MTFEQFTQSSVNSPHSINPESLDTIQQLLLEELSALDTTDAQLSAYVDHQDILKPFTFSAKQVYENDPYDEKIVGESAQSLFDSEAAEAEALERAKKIIDHAQETATSMIQQARDAIEQERVRVLEDAYNTGKSDGLAAADSEMAHLISTCEKIGLEAAEERERIRSSYERDTVDLAIAIAERIVNASLQVKPELVIDICQGAMRKAFQRGNMVVVAHPDDLTILQEAGPKLAQALGNIENLDFVGERRMNRGDVVVRTPMGDIDSTIASKTDVLASALRDQVRANDNRTE